MPSKIFLGSQEAEEYTLLKKGTWLYFFLLIFEGALRKWLLPGFAAPLLIIRDPLALYLILLSWRKGILPSTFYLKCVVFIGVTGFFTAIFLGHRNLWVALFGARTLLIQLPFVFVIGRIFNRIDILQIGKAMLCICLPMTVLIGLQFYSPQTAWVNRGLGGVIDEKGFQGALGHFRPSGTFSYVTGTYLFFGLTACYLIYYWLMGKGINKILLTASTIAIIAAIPLSISRTLFFEVCITIVFAFIAVTSKSKYLVRMFLIAIIATLTVILLSKTSTFSHAIATFFARFTDASKAEGGVKGTLGDRFLGSMISAMTVILDLPFFGYGIGVGTNVGSQLLAGSRGFLVREDEWGRVVDELGPLLGLSLIFLRVFLSLKIAKASYKRLHEGDILPWLLLSFGFLQLAQGNWAQPTSLGFCTLASGLMIASLRTPSKTIAKTTC